MDDSHKGTIRLIKLVVIVGVVVVVVRAPVVVLNEFKFLWASMAFSFLRSQCMKNLELSGKHE